MKRFLVLLALSAAPQIAQAQCYQNGIPCGQNTSAPPSGGAGGGLAATARCKVTYMGYDEPIN